MAKEQKRGNREVKKPKKDKPKAAIAASPFAATPPGKGQQSAGATKTKK